MFYVVYIKNGLYTCFWLFWEIIFNSTHLSNKRTVAKQDLSISFCEPLFFLSPLISISLKRSLRKGEGKYVFSKSNKVNFTKPSGRESFAFLHYTSFISCVICK